MRPNILFIMTDEQRFDTLGTVNSAVRTPHLDQLAREGISFTRAYTTNPSCVPARAAIITGRYPSKCGAPTYITHLPPHEVTFTSLLQQQGYYTAVLGKQHFGDSLIDRGYDHADIIDLHGPGDWDIEGESETSYMKFLKAAGFTRTSQLSERVNRYSQRWITEARYHIDDYIGELCKSWLRHQRPKGQPWYCCLSFPGPHMPFDGAGLPQETGYRLEDIDLPLTEESDLDSKPPHFRQQLVTGQGNPGGAMANGMTKQELRETRLSYYANMSLIDQKIGEVITELKAAGEYDNTLILFTSDHGEYMGDFGMMGKGQYLSEVLMRVPFLIKPPVSGFTGRTEEAFVSNLDIAATCLSAAGAQVPGNMDSVDLSPFWKPGAEKPVKDTVYLEAGDLRAVRNESWKLVYYRGRPYGELYHLKEDPWERHNLWENASASGVKEQLKSLLMDELLALGERSHMPWNDKAPQI
ncbi:sulfatase [Paenibacillus sp. JSM ZJ436]|uniref:sulfatase n=1 Tax=Paenibacillus sp. JSM ZJ436 TaxID=3376190 RepID=UPI0037B413D6